MTASDDPRHRFEELWDTQHAAVLAYALRRTDPDTARDVVAEAFTANDTVLGAGCAEVDLQFERHRVEIELVER